MFPCSMRERAVLSPRPRPSPYLPWPVEKGLTVTFTEGQVCHEYWAGPHSCDRPLFWIFSRKEQSEVFGPWWEMHPLECDFERTMWDRQEGLPFLSKKLLLLRLWEVQRSNVPSAHSLQHTKPTADVATLSRNPQGISGNNWLHSELHNSSCAQSEIRIHVCFSLSQGKLWTLDLFYTFTLTRCVVPPHLKPTQSDESSCSDL